MPLNPNEQEPTRPRDLEDLPIETTTQHANRLIREALTPRTILRTVTYHPPSPYDNILANAPPLLKRPNKPHPRCKTCHVKMFQCANCGTKCRNCCKCKLFCKDCRRQFQFYQRCRWCGGCRRHCKCTMQNPRKAGKINTLARPLGVELEMINTNIMSEDFRVKYAQWEHDATIHPSGLELVVQPASGDEFVKQMLNIYEAIIRGNADVNESCGLHVHVQAGDLSAWEIRRLIVLWCRIEKEVYRYLVAPHRLSDSHCTRYAMPLSTELIGERVGWQFSPANLTGLMRTRYNSATKIKTAIIKKLYTLDLGVPQRSKAKADQQYLAAVKKYKAAAMQFDRWKQNKRTPGQAEGMGCRYASLNLHSLFHRGTVEFRLKEGSIEPEALLLWPMFCGWIVEGLSRISDRDVMRIHGLIDWLNLMRGIAQPEVLEWVREKVK